MSDHCFFEVDSYNLCSSNFHDILNETPWIALIINFVKIPRKNKPETPPFSVIWRIASLYFILSEEVCLNVFNTRWEFDIQSAAIVDNSPITPDLITNWENSSR